MTIRLRLLFQTILTIAPVIALIFYINLVSLRNSKQLQINQLKNTVRLVATEQMQIIEGARQLLITLSTSDQIKNPTSNCANYLSEVLSKYQRYSNIALADTRGNVVCSANTPESPINISDRYFFKSILETKDFIIGEYSVSKITKESIISFAYPVFNNDGIFSGVIYSSLDLNWLSKIISNLDLNEKAVLMILDRKGKVLTKNVDLDSVMGKPYSSEKLIKNLNKNEGFVEVKEKNHERFFYAFKEIGSTKSSLYVAVGLPESVVYRVPNKAFKNSIFISLAIGLMSIIGGWFAGKSLITNMIAAITKVDQLKKDFVSLVSHQLRTPLTAIKYFNEILLSGSPGNLEPKQKEFLQDSLASTNRLIFLVGTLLNISRLESGKIKFNLQKESLPRLIRSSQLEINHLFIQKKLKFIFQAQTSKPALIDAKLINQVVANLLTNAVKYSNPKTAIETKITIGKVEIITSIKNYGIVISQDERVNVFTKFFRSEAVRKVDQEGSGLGLYLSKLIVEMHGGRIWFTSSTKSGTTFFFTIPT